MFWWIRHSRPKKPQLVGLFCGTNYIETFKSDLYKSLFNWDAIVIEREKKKHRQHKQSESNNDTWWRGVKFE